MTYKYVDLSAPFPLPMAICTSQSLHTAHVGLSLALDEGLDLLPHVLFNMSTRNCRGSSTRWLVYVWKAERDVHGWCAEQATGVSRTAGLGNIMR